MSKLLLPLTNADVLSTNYVVRRLSIITSKWPNSIKKRQLKIEQNDIRVLALSSWLLIRLAHQFLFSLNGKTLLLAHTNCAFHGCLPSSVHKHFVSDIKSPVKRLFSLFNYISCSVRTRQDWPGRQSALTRPDKAPRQFCRIRCGCRLFIAQ